jgi:hypothetical protein
MTSTDATGPEPLDFTTPEPGDSAVTCTGCRQPIADQYWSAGEAILCERCKTAVEEGQQGAPDVMSRAGRFTRAVLFGLVAMLLGAAAWYAVAKLANLEVGLIAILLGYLVGKAVFIGSARRGGLRYQVLAVFLTYLGIGTAYVPFAFEGLRQRMQAEADSVRAADSIAAVATPAAEELAGGQPGPDAARLDSLPQAAQAAPADDSPARSIGLVLSLALVLFGILTIPISLTIGGLPGSLISLLIYSFAIMQAWRMTGSARIAISGPFRLGQAAPA